MSNIMDAIYPTSAEDENENEWLTQVTTSDSLVMLNGSFSPSRLSSMSQRELKDKRRDYSFYLQILYRRGETDITQFSHRLYFTCPLKLDFIEPDKLPDITGSKSIYIRSLIDPMPVFSPIADEYFYEKFDLLDKELNRSYNENRGNTEFVENRSYAVTSALTQSLSRIISNEDSRTEEFTSRIAWPCIGFLASITEGFRYEKSVLTDDESRLTYVPDKVVLQTDHIMDDKVMLIVEFKAGALKKFIIDDRSLNEKDDSLKSIIKQVSSYMIRKKKDHCLLSDLENTIFLKLNNKKGSREVTPDPKEVIVHLQYRVITTHDTGITLQAIFASLVFYEYYINSLDEEKDLEEEYKMKKMALAQQSHQVEYLKKRMVSRKRAMEVQSEISDASSKAIRKMCSETTQYKNVKLEKFNQIVTIESETQLEVVRESPLYMSQIYRFKYHQFSDYFNKRLQNRPKPDEDVVLKVYDFRFLEGYMLTYKSDLEMYSLNDLYGIDDMYQYAYGLFLNEIACYERILKYKDKYPVKVPTMYDYGLLHYKVEGELISCGLYIMVSYIESESIKSFEQVKHDIKELKRQIKMLGRIGINHNDLELRNLIYNKAGFNIIDFSHGQVHPTPVSTESDTESVKQLNPRTLVEQTQTSANDMLTTTS